MNVRWDLKGKTQTQGPLGFRGGTVSELPPPNYELGGPTQRSGASAQRADQTRIVVAKTFQAWRLVGMGVTH
jgi:hypothetical protein